MQQVVAIRTGRVTQINNRDVVPIGLTDIAVVAHDVAFSIRRKKTHAGCQGVLNAWVEPVGGLTYTGRAEHKCVNVAGIHEGSVLLRASHDQSLRNDLFRNNNQGLASFLPDKVTEPQRY